VKGGAGNILDALHQVDELLVIALPDGGKSNSTIADDGGRYTSSGRRLKIGIPGRLAIKMRMYVYKAGRDEKSGRVNFSRSGRLYISDSNDVTVFYSYVRDPRQGAAPVNQLAISYEQIEHHSLLSGVCGTLAYRLETN
jgi:hypothetical protein